MKFRPCVDIHNGKVKQIVGSSLLDQGNKADENFVSQRDSSFYANLYKQDNILGGHIILLNSINSEFYNATKNQALMALKEYPKGLQIGGGMNDKNAESFLIAGASHIIITSYVFSNGKINRNNLEKIKSAIGKENLVLDLSCRKKDGKYYIVTDRWQKFTEQEVNLQLLDDLANHCAEFLVHAVDVEGKVSGIETELVSLLGNYQGIPITYAGGIRSLDDIKKIREIGNDRLDFTIGSALDLFGGKLKYADVVNLVSR